MKTFAHKSIAAYLFVVMLALSPLFAQQKLLGDLSITANSAEGFVTVNGERVTNGRSITSPSLIVTSPQASSKVSLANTGTVAFSPNSKVNLSFITSNISMDITSGEITVETLPNTSLNIFTPDGNLTLPIENQANDIKVTVADGKTLIQVLTGKARFNSVLISAGESYPVLANIIPINTTAENNNSRGFNPLIIIGLLGAVAVIAVVALSGSSDNGESPVNSPIR